MESCRGVLEYAVQYQFCPWSCINIVTNWNSSLEPLIFLVHPFIDNQQLSMIAHSEQTSQFWLRNSCFQALCVTKNPNRVSCAQFSLKPYHTIYHRFLTCSLDKITRYYLKYYVTNITLYLVLLVVHPTGSNWSFQASSPRVVTSVIHGVCFMHWTTIWVKYSLYHRLPLRWGTEW